MFRISWNWKTGRCKTEPIEGILKPLSGSTTTTPPHVLLAGSATFIASSDASPCPEIHVLQQGAAAPKQVLLCSSRQSLRQLHITAIALDQSPPASGLLRIAVFLSTGEVLGFLVHQNPEGTCRKFTYVPARRTGRIIRAAYHHPLLVSLSEAFDLSLYDLSADAMQHTQTLTSYTTFPPSSLTLIAQIPGVRYKLVLAYSTPVFPLHFSIGK
ncbi:hypothetical protein MKEN_00685000 [Mycena kentingensis (nom. inval.)]|nr:hypothetical protein MKEN_00685000 [Mycena kentingensis (nom. inval.)]